MGASQRTKGHSFERWVAAELRSIWPEARRGYQARGGTKAAPDVDGTPFYIECKAHKVCNRREALNQAVAGTDGRPAVAVCKDDRKPPTVTLAVSLLHDMLTEVSWQVATLEERVVRVTLDFEDWKLIASQKRL